MKDTSPGKWQSGFTLAEILVASSILVVMAALVLSITSTIARVWDNTSGQLSAGNQSRLTLDLMANDLGSAILRNQAEPWFQMEWESGEGRDGFSHPGSLHLMFFAYVNASAGAQTGSALSAVSYRIAYRDPFQNAPDGEFAQFGLYRGVMDAGNTFRHALEERENLKADLWDRSETTPWEDLGGDGRSLSPRDWSLDVANLLATHVVGMSGLLNYRDASGVEKTIQVGEDGAQSLTLGGQLRVDGQVEDFSEIQSLEIRLQVVTETGAQWLRAELDALPDNDRGMTYADIIAREGEIYSQRIAFYREAL